MDEYTERSPPGAEFHGLCAGAVHLGQNWSAGGQVLPLALRVQEERLVRLSTSQLNHILHERRMTTRLLARGRQFKIYYGTQVRSDPPTFLIYVNDPKLAHFSYVRYLENRIREEYAFTGTPIRLVFRPRR